MLPPPSEATSASSSIPNSKEYPFQTKVGRIPRIPRLFPAMEGCLAAWRGRRGGLLKTKPGCRNPSRCFPTLSLGQGSPQGSLLQINKDNGTNPGCFKDVSKPGGLQTAGRHLPPHCPERLPHRIMDGRDERPRNVALSRFAWPMAPGGSSLTIVHQTMQGHAGYCSIISKQGSLCSPAWPFCQATAAGALKPPRAPGDHILGSHANCVGNRPSPNLPRFLPSVFQLSLSPGSATNTTLLARQFLGL